MASIKEAEIEINKELALRLKMYESTLLAMFTADAEAGCGFYTDGEWQDAYLALQKMIGCNLFTCVHDPRQGDINNDTHN